MTRRQRALASVLATVTMLLAPASASAHGLAGRLDSPLPLAVYLIGAAIVVALSFVIALFSGARWQQSPEAPLRRMPSWLVLPLRAVGVVAWLWIVVQTVLGGSSDAEVATLFTWVYGWVGVAIVCALLGPVWQWIDPFATLHDLGAGLLRVLRVRGLTPVSYPERLASWPAVAGFALFVWLELVFRGAPMGLIVIGYSLITLAGMAQYGKDAWRERGEVFSVWFGLLGRVAHWAAAGAPGSPRVRRLPFPDGLVGSRWDGSLVTLTALGVASILYDGLSQSQLFFELFGIPNLASATGLLAAFTGLVVLVTLLVARRVGLTALGAGLVPIAVGYLIAHYLTYLLGDGQRIIVAISDPFQLGWDLFGTAFFEPSTAWIAPSLLWTIMMISVIGGHIAGAWAGHLAALRFTTGTEAQVRRAQIPLAILMVGLTTLTLWSLGQEVVREGATTPAVSSAGMTGAEGPASLMVPGP